MGAAALLGIIVLLALFVVGLYNSLVRLRLRVKNAWSQIDVQMKRRHDLIPNLMETVKGYMAHERETLENVTNARAGAVNATGVEAKGQAENMLTSALRTLFAVAENYPDLKANQNFLSLQEELTTTENRIAFSRQHYNDEVMTYNTAIQTVPRNIVAQMFNFEKAEFLAIEDQEKEVPKVEF